MGEAGTQLYRDTIAFPGPHQALMRQVWKSTPWMVDLYTGGTASERDKAIREWCLDQIGPEAFPIHGKDGRWQRGGATINGWTWFGFASEIDMHAALGAFPAPSDLPSGEKPFSNPGER